MEKSRRSFIKTVAAGTAGAALFNFNALPARAYNRIIGANDRLRVGLAGLGRRMGAFYEPIALKSSNVELAYLCDVMQKQLENGASKFAKHIDYSPKLEKDIRKVIEDTSVDVLINARSLAYPRYDYGGKGREACVRRKTLQPQPQGRGIADGS
jgi:hypothetical protein